MRRCAVIFFFPICVFVSFMAHEMWASTLSFAPPLRYAPGGNGPNSAVIADLNGDGKLDVVVSDWCVSNTVPCPNGAVGVLLGNGDGRLLPAVTTIREGFMPPVSPSEISTRMASLTSSS